MGLRSDSWWLGTRSTPQRIVTRRSVGLLPLLELSWRDATHLAQELLENSDAVSLARVVDLALGSHSDYWTGNALAWLEDGFRGDVRRELSMPTEY